jgi:hypothetical protein
LLASSGGQEHTADPIPWILDMDRKQAILLSEVLQRINSGTFDELDVQNLLIMLRPDDARAAPVLFELGSFVAHRNRDRGRIHNAIAETLDRVNARGAVQVEDTPIGGVISAAEVAQALDTELQRLSLPSLSQLRHTQMQTAMIFLLRHSPMFTKVGSQFGFLDVHIGRSVISLNGSLPLKLGAAVGLSFPVFSVPNVVYPMSYEHMHIGSGTDLGISFDQGNPKVAGLKPYEFHIGRIPLEMVLNYPAVEWGALKQVLIDLPISNLHNGEQTFDVLTPSGERVLFRLHDGMVSFSGVPHLLLAPHSIVREIARTISERLHVPIFDDNNQTLSLDGNGPLFYTTRWLPRDMQRPEIEGKF